MPTKETNAKDVVRRLLKEAGTTYADEAGITLKDSPMPLFQLLTLCMLASKPIDAGIAVAAARELFHSGIRTPDSVLDADRKTMIDAFGRASYARYDESSATRLVEMAQAVRDEYGGDLRKLAEAADHDAATAAKLLQRFKGIGETGSDIFLRKVQDTWTWVRPYFDDRATTTAKQLGLPTDPTELGSLAGRSNAELAAALVRASLDDDVRDAVAT
ncbi:endonuclease [Mycolicibacterium sediminis]|uniref:Endonuclease n=1 Tax=Mycolicibacterium sediminis TaxID=1286180 RepID=A0A7I7QW46_9MYCO|nr:endonuclease [Mycolicibacterium sediminis]BBY30136.1 endonuclease [Mycolicibacterium sediminis]